ncbi:MAG: glycosyltransferase [Rhabdochlamydiaceae bacterium]|nr:glycosyltransferase [Candidatus Amphrikana amoebophyrae]
MDKSINKVALVHDWLFQFAGAEKVLSSMTHLFPGDIYSLFADPKWQKHELFNNLSIFPSNLNRMPKVEKYYRNLLQLFPKAINSFDLSKYDLILSSSHAVAGNVKTRKGQLHICYCHTPMRYIWDLMDQYLLDVKPALKKWYVKRALLSLQSWDLEAKKGVDYFIANSHFIANRIKRVYNRDVDQVIYPPVDTKKFQIGSKEENYFVTLSRLVPYKKIDLIVEAFKHLPNERLVVIGEGPQMAQIKEKAGNNIELLGYVEDAQSIIQKARGFIFAALEDFGISPVEAMSCGIPVIALGKGGTFESVIEGTTGVHFPTQDIKSIVEGLNKFKKIESYFCKETIRSHAQTFSTERFEREYTQFIEEKL